jgi:hypothetical protein
MGHLSGLSAKGLTLVTPTAKLNVHYLFLVSGVSPIIAEGVAMPDRTEDHRLFFAAELGASAGWRVRRFAQALAGEHQIGGRPIPPSVCTSAWPWSSGASAVLRTTRSTRHAD